MDFVWLEWAFSLRQNKLQPRLHTSKNLSFNSAKRAPLLQMNHSAKVIWSNPARLWDGSLQTMISPNPSWQLRSTHRSENAGVRSGKSHKVECAIPTSGWLHKNCFLHIPMKISNLCGGLVDQLQAKIKQSHNWVSCTRKQEVVFEFAKNPKWIIHHIIHYSWNWMTTSLSQHFRWWSSVP